MVSLAAGSPTLAMVIRTGVVTGSAPLQSGQGTPRQMTMDWFICTCITVEKVWMLYDDIYRPGDRPRIRRDEFLEKVISLP